MSRGHSSYQNYFQYDSVSLGGGSLVSRESSASLLHRVSPAAGAATPALSPGGGSYQGRAAQQVSPYNYSGQDTVSVVCRASRANTSLSMDNVHREAGAGASEEVRPGPRLQRSFAETDFFLHFFPLYSIFFSFFLFFSIIDFFSSFVYCSIFLNSFTITHRNELKCYIDRSSGGRAAARRSPRGRWWRSPAWT